MLEKAGNAVSWFFLGFVIAYFVLHAVSSQLCGG